MGLGGLQELVMDREEGGRGVSGWGNTCTHMADSCRCMAETTTIL